ncbi:MAG: aspartate carbamoyltransferase regulatory subunit [Clostridia bacterium]|nr:aspartate carbamoyltransferase regulatory subunit [Clostridia bacterium]
MIVNPIENGIVLDHIKAGNGMELYKALNLDKLGSTVALIINADSRKMGKKDIIKIDEVIDLNFDILGYIDPDVTVNVIKNGKNEKLAKIEPPQTVTNLIHCKNPRCITSTEQELDHVFKLTDRENMVYRCIYCETKAK